MSQLCVQCQGHPLNELISPYNVRLRVHVSERITKHQTDSSLPCVLELVYLIPQLDTVVIEVSLVKVLKLRSNPRRLYRAKHLPSQNWTGGDTGCYSGQTSYLSMKVLTFVKDEKIGFFIELISLC